MELFGTARSHFTRKIRLLLDHLQYEYEFLDIGDVSQIEFKNFQFNPSLSVPVFKDKGQVIYDSDNIAAYIVRNYDEQDRYGVLTQDIKILNARAIINSAMSAEVRLILAERTGIETENIAYFDKARAVIFNCLQWCEENVDLFQSKDLSYLTFHLISFWDHVHFYSLAGGHWPSLQEIINYFHGFPEVKASAIS